MAPGGLEGTRNRRRWRRGGTPAARRAPAGAVTPEILRGYGVPGSSNASVPTPSMPTARGLV
jgi:hypothetical protein